MAADAIPQPPSAANAIALGLRYGPNAGAALQRSQYLADALRALQAGGNEIRTPGALGTSLLAEGLTQYAKKKADAEALSAYGKDRQSLADNAVAGLGDDQAPAPQPAVPPPPPPQAPQSPPTTTPHQPAASPASSPPGPTALARGLRNNNPLNVTTLPDGQAWNGQSGADGNYAKFATAQDGWNAADKNLTAYALKHGINTVDGAVGRWSPGAPPAYAQQVAAALKVAPGQQVDFTNPDVRQRALTAMAGFENGQPVQFGQGAMPAAQAQQPPIPQPAQSPPAPVPSGAPAAGGAAPPSAPPAGAAPAIPHGVVTPEEVALTKQLLADPRTYDQGLAMAYKLKERQAAPVDPSKPYWGPDGQAHYAPGNTFTDVAGPQNAYTQRDPQGKIVSTARPDFGSLPTGTQLNNGVVSQLPTSQMQTFRMPGVNGVFVNGPDGRPVKVGDDQYGPEQLIALRDKVVGSEPMKLLQASNDAYGAMVNAAKLGQGGMRAYALRDTFARAINPGAVARVGTIQAIKEAQGIPENIKSFLMNLKGDGDVSPEVAQQILDVTQGFVASHYAGAKALNDSNVEFAQRHNFNPEDITAPLGDAPQRFVVPHPAPAPAAPSAAASQLQDLYAAGKLSPQQVERARKLGVIK